MFFLSSFFVAFRMRFFSSLPFFGACSLIFCLSRFFLLLYNLQLEHSLAHFEIMLFHLRKLPCSCCVNACMRTAATATVTAVEAAPNGSTYIIENVLEIGIECFIVIFSSSCFMTFGNERMKRM